MSTIFIIHGVGGNPQENWFPWLKAELEKRGAPVVIPQFPTPENQTLEAWMKVFAALPFENDSIIIGHSLGVPFSLNVLEKRRARAAFLVAGFVGLAGNSFDPGMATFAQRTFDWQRIRSNCDHFEVFHSDNDPYIQEKKARELAELLLIAPQIIPNAGHFNSASGYTAFPLLLSRLEPFLKP